MKFVEDIVVENNNSRNTEKVDESKPEGEKQIRSHVGSTGISNVYSTEPLNKEGLQVV